MTSNTQVIALVKVFSTRKWFNQDLSRSFCPMNILIIRSWSTGTTDTRMKEDRLLNGTWDIKHLETSLYPDSLTTRRLS